MVSLARQNSKKNKQQKGFSLIEIAIVILLLLGVCLWGGYFILQQKNIANANVVAAQLNDIAKDVLNYEWHEPSEFNTVQTYNLNGLIEKGVVKKRDYILDYSVLMYWRDKYTYDLLVYVESPQRWDIAQLKEIAGLIGAHGGFVDEKGNVISTASAIITRITPDISVELSKNSPVVLYQEVNHISVDELPFIPKIVKLSAKFSEWGKDTEKNYLTSNIISWKPSYISDYFCVSWEMNSSTNFPVTIRLSYADTGKIFRQQVVTGKYSFLPSENLLGKTLLVELIYKKSVLISRKILVNSQPDESQIVTQGIVGAYIVKGEDIVDSSSELIKTNELFICPKLFSVDVGATGMQGGTLIKPISYIINSTGSISRNIMNIDINSIPYSFDVPRVEKIESAIRFCTAYANEVGSQDNLTGVMIKSVNSGRSFNCQLKNKINIIWE